MFLLEHSSHMFTCIKQYALLNIHCDLCITEGPTILDRHSHRKWHPTRLNCIGFIHYVLCIMHYALYIMHYTIYKFHYAGINSLQIFVHLSNKKLCTTNHKVNLFCYACIMNYVSCIMCYAISIMHAWLYFVSWN